MHKHNRRLLNLPMLLRIIGWLLCIEGVFMIIPTVTGFIYGEADRIPFLITAVVTLGSGIGLSRWARPRQAHLGKRDGFLLTASVWVVFSFFGLFPFLFSSTPLSFTDAFFEAMSGFTTTGVSVIADTARISHALHIWRAMMQWIGGMGIVLFTLAIIPMLNHSGGMQMFNAEVTGVTHDKIRPRISQTAKLLWLIYFILTGLCIALLWAGPMSLFEAVCHAFGTVSTGGYTTAPDGIRAWTSTPYVKVVITVFMFISGVSFVMLFKVFTGHIKALRHNEVFRTFVEVIAVVWAVYAVSILIRGNYDGWQSITIDPLFHIVSTITSTGYECCNFEAWGPLAIALTIIMMFSGGCAGSTSGGAKVDRMLYLFKNTRNEVHRCIYPNAIMPVKINDTVADPDLVTKVIAFLGLFALLIVGGGVALAACGAPVADSFFSAFSCMANTGFDAALIGGSGSFASLPLLSKWVLCFLMLTGRLEIFTVLVLFTSPFWRR